jgi:hypothetical protein
VSTLNSILGYSDCPELLMQMLLSLDKLLLTCLATLSGKNSSWWKWNLRWRQFRFIYCWLFCKYISSRIRLFYILRTLTSNRLWFEHCRFWRSLTLRGVSRSFRLVCSFQFLKFELLLRSSLGFEFLIL